VYLGRGDGNFDGPQAIGLVPSNFLAVGEFNGDGATDLAVAAADTRIRFGQPMPGAGTTLASSANPSTYGQSVNLTASTSPASATGSVSFSDGTTSLGMATLANGQATLTTNLLAAGNHTLQAYYAGDNSNFSSRSQIIAQVVAVANSTLALTASSNPASLRQFVRIAGVIQPVFAGGTVTFFNHGDVLAVVPVVHGVAELLTSTLPLGVNSIAASYSGDRSSSPSAASLTVTINPGVPSVVKLTSTTNSVTYGQPVTLTASVPSDATGAVSFYDGMSPLGSRPVVNGQAVLTTPAILSGNRSITAYYSGDGTYSPGRSSILTESVHTVVGAGFAPAASPSVQASFVVTADFNQDGIPDLAAGGVGKVSVYLGTGNGTFQPAWTISTSQAMSLASGDFNGDGNPDLVMGWLSNSLPMVTIFAGRGDGTFGPGVDFSLGISAGTYYSANLAVGDFNGDGRADVVIGTDSNGRGVLAVLLGTGDGSFLAPSFTPGFRNDLVELRSIAISDFNGDGIADLAIGDQHIPSGGIYLLLGRGDGSFSIPVSIKTGVAPASIATADFNGDGIVDLVVANRGDNTVTLLPGKGDGSFGPAVNLFVALSPSSVIVADFDGDGNQDLAIATRVGVARLTGHGDGAFEDPVYFGPMASGIAAADFNGDGKPDIAVAAVSTLGVLLGQTDPAFSVGPGIFNAAAPISASPGSQAMIFGSFPAGAPPAVQFNGEFNAPILSVAAGRLTFQVPWELTGQSVPQMTVFWNGQSSPPQQVQAYSISPAIFTTNNQGTGQGLIYDTSGRLADATNPAIAGSSVVKILCTGLGPVTNQPPTGEVPPATPAAAARLQPFVQIGGHPAGIVSANLSPGMIGVYEIQAIVPALSQTGDAVPVVLSNSTATMAVRASQ